MKKEKIREEAKPKLIFGRLRTDLEEVLEGIEIFEKLYDLERWESIPILLLAEMRFVHFHLERVERLLKECLRYLKQE